MSGDDALGGLAFGVDGEALGGEFTQLCDHAGAGREGVFIEVEAQGVAAGEWGVVLRHGKDAGAGLG